MSGPDPNYMEAAGDDLVHLGGDWASLQYELQLNQASQPNQANRPAAPPTDSTPGPQSRLGPAALPHQPATTEPTTVAMTTDTQPYGQSSSYESAEAEETKQEPTPPRDQHRRGYQACDPCRKRKVRCDLGSVDNPHDPPCMRCRREHKNCVFSTTRRKRKQSQEADDASSDGGPGRDKRRLTEPTDDVKDDRLGYSFPYSSASPYPQNANMAPQWPPHPMQTSHPMQARSSNGYELNTLVDSNSRAGGRSSQTLSPRPLAPITSPRTNPRNANEHMVNKEAANILHPSIATSHEALHLLSVAAGQTEEANRQNSQSLPSHLLSPSTTFGTPSSAGASHRRTMSHTMAPGEQTSDQAARYGMMSGPISDTAENQNYQEALKMWSRMRLVKDGWFTATEAIAYIDYYYEHLAPMTPVVINNYRPLSMHTSLVTDEPILAVTMLTIASRHMQLAGPGATSRAYQIHDVLWNNLRGMVQRLVWGQEQFGGGFFGGGAVKTHESRTGQVTWKGSLRTLGTIEALLLLTDWHPRALHFPPGDNENRLLDADFPLTEENEAPEADSLEANEDGKVAFSSWLEPAWRSDRMSWMLLGAAVTLSFELGVFDKEHYNCKDHHEPDSECARKQRVRRMVLVYVSQTSGRLGFTPMLSFETWRKDPVFEETDPTHRNGPTDPIELMQECWMGIAGLMYKANEEIFSSKQYTRDLTSSGQYIEAIARFKPMLQDWKANFDRVRHQFDPVMQHLLSMEYDYARLYINSLGLQKVVESWINITNEAATNANHHNNASHGVGDASAVSGGITFSLLLEIWRPNKEYIDEVSDAARGILKTVKEGLVPGGHLTHASVRSYFRVLSGLMFTLKRFSFGASEQGVRESFMLLDSITDELTRSVVDDVHLSARTAELVKMLSSHLRAKFIRLQAPNSGSTGSSRENSRHQTPQRQQDQSSLQHQFAGQPGQPQARTALNSQFIFGQDLPSLHDPLAGIQAQSMSEVTNVAYMPPTNYNDYMDGNQGGLGQNPADFGTGVDDLGDWFALPLNNFFSTDPAPVHQGFGGIGPTVGSRDMLEFITNEQYDR